MTSNGQCPGLDMAKGINQFGGSEDLYLSILRFYVDDMKTILESAKPYDAGDPDAYVHTTHSIKGSSRNVFADEIGDAAEGLEQAAKNGDAAYIEQHQEEFFTSARKLIQDIDEMLSVKGL